MAARGEGVRGLLTKPPFSKLNLLNIDQEKIEVILIFLINPLFLIELINFYYILGSL